MATRKGSTDAQMMFVGSACSRTNCNQHDFLPIRCDLCASTFCSDHFRPVDHACPKYDHLKADRVAPSCPLCNVPISIPVGHDPNIKMDAHIMNDCSAMGTKRPAKSQAPRCTNTKCRKVLIAPIRCESCSKDFCPEHRFPQQHSCASLSTTSIPRPAQQPTSSKLADKFSNISIAGTRPGQSGPAARAALAAMSRAATRPKPTPAASTDPEPKVTPASTSRSSNKSSVPNPFNKTDRCDPHLPTSTTTTTDVVPTADVAQSHNRPSPTETSYRPPPIFASA